MDFGFLVNPVAGMGGAVGLKGTDGVVDEAIELGAENVSFKRAKRFLKHLNKDIRLLTCSAPMGVDESGFEDCEVAYFCEEKTDSSDTIKACKTFMDRCCDAIVFVGGDGTARDVLNAVGEEVPVIGIPSGVKMHSSVFAVSPEKGALLLQMYAQGKAKIQDAEVIDVDEEAFRDGRLSTRVYGVVKTVFEPDLVQAGKAFYEQADDERAKKEIAMFAKEFMGDGSAYILGAGTTTAAIAEAFGVEKTLLGVDVLKDGKLILKDAKENELLALLEKKKSVKVIVTPIGAQGFVFGRGTQQISANVLEKVGVKNIIYASTPSKLNNLRYLIVDTGNPRLDEALTGYRSVVIGYRLSQRKDVKAC